MRKRASVGRWAALLLLVAALLAAWAALRPERDPLATDGRNTLEQALLQDRDREVRGISARALGHIGDTEAVDSLLKAYANDEAILTEVVEALMDLGVNPTELRDINERRGRARFPFLYGTRDWILKFDLRLTLITIGQVGLFVFLVTTTLTFIRARRKGSAKGASFRRAMTVGLATAVMYAVAFGSMYWALVKLAPREVEPDVRVAEIAIIELARETKDRASVEWLVEVLGDETRAVEARWRAAQALGAIRDVRALRPLQAAMGYDNPRIRMFASWAVGNLFAAKLDLQEDKLDLAELDASLRARLEEALNLQPESAMLYLQSARLHTEDGEYAEALADLDHARVLSPSHPAEILMERGWALALSDRTDEALVEYDRAIAADDRMAKAYLRRGLSHAALGHFPDALADFTKASELDAELADAWRERGHVYRRMSRNGEALSDYRDYLRHSPGAPDHEFVRSIIRKLSSAQPATR